MKIFVLVVEDLFDTGLTSVLDTLEIANDLALEQGINVNFEVTIAGVRESLRTRRGLHIAPTLATSLAPPNLAIVPALSATTPETISKALQRSDVSDIGSILQSWYQAGTVVTAACTGTYILAATGILDGVRATTPLWLAPDFRKRFPNVILDESKMLVEQQQQVTAGTALAHFDLALWIICQQSPALGQLVSRHLMLDGRVSQTVHAMSSHLVNSDPLIEQFEYWTRQNLSNFSMVDAVREINTSERTLQRRFREVLGCTPIAFVQRLRVEQSLHLLQTTDASIEEIAESVGYQDGVTLRTLLRKKTGCNIRELRNTNR
ncbi:MAG: helix-turn-helix domain-containing protein [Cyanobacteria bacterium J06626_14]